MDAGEVFVGVDVSKEQLDVATRPAGERWKVANSEAGRKGLIRRLANIQPELVVMEATGGWEMTLAWELAAAGHRVAIVNPGRVRHFAKSLGILAKTDAIDAQVLSHFAQVTEPKPRPLEGPEILELRAQVTRRQQLLGMIVQEENRLALAPKPLHRAIKKHIAWLKKELRQSDTDLTNAIKSSPAWRVEDKLLQSVPGVGAKFSASLISGLPELGKLTNREIAALVGVAPHNKDSGKFKGRRVIWGGRAHIRMILYMATFTARQFNPVIKAYFKQLRAKGKPYKVALVACMRKLLTILNAIVRDQMPWNPLRST